MVCPLCTETLKRNAELVETNALLASMLQDLLSEVQVAVENLEAADPVR